MKLPNKKLIVGLVFAIVLAVVLYLGASTTFFRGAVLDFDSCEEKVLEYNNAYGGAVALLEVVQESATAITTIDISNTLDQIQQVSNELNGINTRFQQEAIDCGDLRQEGLDTLQQLIADVGAQNSVLQDVNQELEALSQQAQICPWDSEEHPNYQLFDDFRLNHMAYDIFIEDLNDLTAYSDQDERDLMSLMVDLSIVVGAQDPVRSFTEDTDETAIAQTFTDELPTLREKVNFTNELIADYNDEALTYINQFNCELAPLSNLNMPATCPEGTVYDEAQASCVSLEPECPYTDVFADFDLIYGFIESNAVNPDGVDEESHDLLNMLLLNAVNRLGDLNEDSSDLFAYIDNNDFEGDAENIVSTLNGYIAQLATGDCFKDFYDTIEIAAATADGEDNICPAGSTYFEDIDVCFCDLAQVAVDKDGVCLGSSDGEAVSDTSPEEEPGTEDTPEEDPSAEDLERAAEEDPTIGEGELYECENGLIVEDPADCFEVGEESENEDGEMALPSPPEGQSTSKTLASNTDSGVVESPDVQGDTGPGLYALILVFITLLGNLAVWFRF